MAIWDAKFVCIGHSHLQRLFYPPVASFVSARCCSESASQGFSRAATAATPGVSVSVGCDGNPETTRVHNNANHSVKFRSVGSIYQPRSNKPFHVSSNLGPGKAITFQTGYAANYNTLTRQYIYNSDVGSKEGARVVPPRVLSWAVATRAHRRDP